MSAADFTRVALINLMFQNIDLHAFSVNISLWVSGIVTFLSDAIFENNTRGAQSMEWNVINSVCFPAGRERGVCALG